MLECQRLIFVASHGTRAEQGTKAGVGKTGIVRVKDDDSPQGGLAYTSKGIEMPEERVRLWQREPMMNMYSASERFAAATAQTSESAWW